MVKRADRNKMKKFALKKGFTLIETIVAVAILSMAVAGPLTLAVKNIGAAAVSQDQLIAFYLAQEGTEFVRNKIDENILNGNALDNKWLEGLGICASSYGCYINIDARGASISECSDSICAAAELKFDSVSGYYINLGDMGTSFKRIITIYDSNTDEAQISATVSWSGKYGARSFTMHDDIYNWRKINE